MTGIRGEERHQAGGSWLREVVFGINDGLVSNLTLVAGVAGAGPRSSLVLLAGLSGLVAGAASMGIGAYVSEKSQLEFYRSEERREMDETASHPELEREEVRQIYLAKGLSGELLDRVVHALTVERERWVRLMMEEELGLPKVTTRPAVDALVMGAAFAAGAVVPILPFLVLAAGPGLKASVGLSILALFAVGAGRSRFTRRNPFWAGGEMVLAGGAAAFIAWSLVRLLGLGNLGV